jgi:hypothetical protein
MESTTFKNPATRQAFNLFLFLALCPMGFLVPWLSEGRGASLGIISLVWRLLCEWVWILFFAFAAVISFLRLCRGMSYLRITSDGFKARDLIFTTQYRWEDVLMFSAYTGTSSRFQGSIVFTLTEDFKLKNPASTIGRRSCRGEKFDDYLSNYGQDPDYLAGLLNAKRCPST